MAWVFDWHGQDSRETGPLDVGCTVTQTYGAGGGNAPLVVDVLCRASTQGGAESQMNTATTLTIDHDRTIIAHKNEAVALQGNIIDRDAGMNGAGVGEDVSFTLNTVDRHGVAYDTGCLTPGETQEQRCYSADAPAPTLQSRECGGGQGKSFVQRAGENVQPKYIVRRLMPVECGRLQGFPDGWGEIEQLPPDMPEKTAAFWRQVYETDCAIKGKRPQKSILEAPCSAGDTPVAALVQQPRDFPKLQKVRGLYMTHGMEKRTMKKVIAIDFDGVLFTEAYPAVGMQIAPNINRAKNEKANGAVLILWTCREGEKLAEALAACKAVGLEFDYVNENADELKAAFGTDPRKIAATEYWDDKNVCMGRCRKGC